MAKEPSAVKYGPDELAEDLEDQANQSERLQLRVGNLKLTPKNEDNSKLNIYEDSHRWSQSQSSFNDGTKEQVTPRLSAPHKLEKHEGNTNIDQIEVCYSDMPSVEHRETLIQQYSKEP